MDAQEGLGKTWSTNKIAKVAKTEFDVNKLRDKPDLAAKYQLPNDGSGEIKVHFKNCINYYFFSTFNSNKELKKNFIKMTLI